MEWYQYLGIAFFAALIFGLGFAYGYKAGKNKGDKINAHSGRN